MLPYYSLLLLETGQATPSISLIIDDVTAIFEFARQKMLQPLGAVELSSLNFVQNKPERYTAPRACIFRVYVLALIMAEKTFVCFLGV